MRLNKILCIFAAVDKMYSVTTVPQWQLRLSVYQMSYLHVWLTDNAIILHINKCPKLKLDVQIQFVRRMIPAYFSSE